MLLKRCPSTSAEHYARGNRGLLRRPEVSRKATEGLFLIQTECTLVRPDVEVVRRYEAQRSFKCSRWFDLAHICLCSKCSKTIDTSLDACIFHFPPLSPSINNSLFLVHVTKIKVLTPTPDELLVQSALLDFTTSLSKFKIDDKDLLEIK